ncbi:YibE/F family protein [Gordonia sp. HY002]|uniref:YibE/F family protein n=1 Tax=Gordonia zhenghanii TaxID=2911516 RepID=UPI001EF06C06|nr:YibE/F family protein [Gordonia zhenghanii]MCF8572071.1 YibE/F family protein [Gordonia zhenghanii]MCF8602945.1 YibE/F family protein [Gordonia zhenghanii]MCF8605675.1 YibE/F family protein [Gordonia zhenghanii]
MSHRLPDPEPESRPEREARTKPAKARPRPPAAPPPAHHHHHDHGGDIPGVLARYARPAVIVVLAIAALFITVGAIMTWPSDDDHPIPLQFQSSDGGPLKIYDATVVSQTRADCSVIDSGTPTAEYPMIPTTGGPCIATVLHIDSGPDSGEYAALSIPTNAAQSGSGPASQAVGTGAPDDPQPGQPSLSVDDQIRVSAMPSHNADAPDSSTYAFYDYTRGSPLIFWAVAFVLAIVVVATWRGLRAIVGLAVAFAVLGFFTLPSILDGHDVVLVALVSAAAILFVVLYLAHGVSLRTSAALVGTLASLVVAGFLSNAAIASLQLTGLSADSTKSLQLYQGTLSLNGLLLAGFVIGTLGVLNDVTITQASATFELAAMPGQTRLGAFRAAMRVGRDHIASTVYTLVFAYAGSALPLLLLFSVAAQPVSSLLTSEEVAIELARAFVGGIALALSVPLTTAVAAALVVPGGKQAE